MHEQKLSPLEKARLKVEQAKAELLRQEAIERERVKKERRRVIELWGEVAASALAAGELDAQDWAALCTKHLPHENQKHLAMYGIEAYAKPPEAAASREQPKTPEETTDVAESTQGSVSPSSTSLPPKIS